MKRIDIGYGGQSYSVGNRDIDELRDEILAAVSESRTHWLEVNAGEGEPRPTYLLITPGTSLALTPVPGEGEHVESSLG